MKAATLGVIAATMSAYVAAVDLEVGVGATQFHAAANGIWRQDGFKYNLALTTPTFELGVKQQIYPWLGIRTGYRYLGHATSVADALSSDAEYDRYLVEGKTYNESYGHLAKWKGRGEVHGAYTAFTPEYHFSDGTSILFELGMYYYRASWKMHVSEWQACTTCQLQDIQVEHKATWKAEPFYGVGVKYKDTTLMLNLFPSDTGGDDFPAVYGNDAITLTLRKTF